MNTLNDIELNEVNGGIIGWALFVYSYEESLRHIERHPEKYTWTMDWYYGS